jgi:transcriptional regulator with XRE-family HTH domain
VTKAEAKAFGKRLNAVRKEAQVSSNALSDKCEVEPNYIRMIECGTRTPSMSVFIKICNALSISPGYLLCDCLESNEEERFDVLCNRMRELTPKQLEMATAMIEAMIDKME